ncbi:MAG: SMP-30/gluconolactonase/LRE family protein [Chloroflexi bacterium]|nr:SMP-30/gluconolactonase/LRE family protein [Chloroflexota bacterium]
MPETLSDVVESPEPELVAAGFLFTEGPVWHPDGYLLFVDIGRAQIIRVEPGGEPEIIRENSGGSNGMTFDLQGRLIICEGSNRQITRREDDGSYTPIARSWEGKRLDAVNDLVGRSDGTVYFTNPGGGIDPSDRDIEFNGVFRITPDGDVRVAATDFEFPNGIAFSPDESILYVSNTRKWMYIKAFDVQPDGTLVNGRAFADMGVDPPEAPGRRPKGVTGSLTGVPDGMKVDVKGRVFCTGPGGHWVFDKNGNHIGVITMPELPANCAWGLPDNQTMFFTSRSSVYSVRMRAPGTRIPRSG